MPPATWPFIPVGCHFVENIIFCESVEVAHTPDPLFTRPSPSSKIPEINVLCPSLISVYTDVQPSPILVFLQNVKHFC